MVLPASLSQMRGERTACRPPRWTGLALAGLVPLGLYIKVYAGPAADWVNHSLGGVFYVLFWCLLLFWFLPRAKPWRIALAVLMVTCLLEFLQRWHPPWLEWRRSFWLGQLRLGTTFAWSDFLDYFLGAGLGWLWIQRFHPGPDEPLMAAMPSQATREGNRRIGRLPRRPGHRMLLTCRSDVKVEQALTDFLAAPQQQDGEPDYSHC